MNDFLFQNIKSPYITLVRQGSTPANPDADHIRLFLDDTTGALRIVDESGTVFAAGSVAGLLFEAKRSTNLALTADVTPVDFETIASNVGSQWSAGVFTADEDGLYQFTYNLCMTTSTAYILRGYVEGVAKVDGRYSSPGDQRHQCIFTEFLAAGETFEARISTTLTMDGSDNKFNWCRVVRLS